MRDHSGWPAPSRDRSRCVARRPLPHSGSRTGSACRLRLWLPDRRCAAGYWPVPPVPWPGRCPATAPVPAGPGSRAGMESRRVRFTRRDGIGFTVSDWVNSMRCGNTDAWPLCSAAASTRAWCALSTSFGPGAGIGASARRRARASSLSRNRFDGARLNTDAYHRYRDARSGRVDPSARTPRRSGRESSGARPPWRRFRRGKNPGGCGACAHAGTRLRQHRSRSPAAHRRR